MELQSLSLKLERYLLPIVTISDSDQTVISPLYLGDESRALNEIKFYVKPGLLFC